MVSARSDEHESVALALASAHDGRIMSEGCAPRAA
jgi:hypothetical protein